MKMTTYETIIDNLHGAFENAAELSEKVSRADLIKLLHEYFPEAMKYIKLCSSPDIVFPDANFEAFLNKGEK